MKLRIYYYLLFLSLISCTNFNDASLNQKEKNALIKNQLQQNSQKMIIAAKTKSFTEISHLYDTESMLIPEYNPLIINQKNIKVYYEEIFNQENIKKYTRELIDIIVFKNRVIEIGVFTKVLDNSEKYRGKYFNVWRLDNNKQLTLRAEAFGYLDQIKNPNKLVVKKIVNIKPKAIEIPWELEAYNALNETNVIDRIPKKSANSYTNDAMYLPFADSIKTGKSTLIKHYQEYYKNPAKIDSIQIITYALDTVADGYIKYAQFYVDWSVPGFSGNTTGTGISYWRREKDKSLRIHRQIGLHIHK